MSSQSGANTKNYSKRLPPVSIDECLYGPGGVCPPIFNTSNKDDNDEPTTTSSTHSAAAEEQNGDKNNKNELNHKINIQELRRIASQGIEDTGSHRPVAWRVLLSYVPTDMNRWNEVLSRERQNYRNLISELFVQPEDYKHDGGDLRGHQSKRHSKFIKKKQQQQEQNEDDDETKDASENSTSINKNNTIKEEEEEEQENDNDTTTTTTAAAETALQSNETEENETTAAATTTSDDDNEDKTENNTTDNNKGVTSTADASTSDTTTTTENSITTNNDDSSKNDSNNNDNDNNDNKNDEEEDEDDNDNKIKVPKHEPQLINGYVELVPARIKEQWKKSGRDSAALANVISSGCNHDKHNNHMNTLIVVDNEGYTYDKDGNSSKSNRGSGGSGSNKSNNDNSSSGSSDRITVNDDPLSQDVDSKWFQFFENASLLDEIRKDVVRTHPDLFFFLEQDYNLGQRRYAALERILFVWAKLNKGVRYVQGMNEIVGTIYYVLANDLNEEWASEAEADTYFLFNTLMIEMRDVFVPDLDEHDTGIQGRISNIMSLLSLHDPEIRCHLDDCGIDASFFGVRWLTTLLSREFKLPDTIRLWDSMFASTHKDNFMRYVCVTMVMIVRDDLLRGDFSTCLRLLQSYPTTNIDRLLEASRALWIYESQVTLACHKGGISLQKALRSIAPPPSLVMAYGLPGGLASQIPAAPPPPPIPPSQRQTETSMSTSNNKSTNSAAGTLFSGAKEYLSGFGSGNLHGWRRSNSSNLP